MQKTKQTTEPAVTYEPMLGVVIISREGIKLKVGDLVNYYFHYDDETKGKLCIVAYDYHGYMSLFYQDGCRHRVIESEWKYIEYLGHISERKDLINPEVSWAQFL